MIEFREIQSRRKIHETYHQRRSSYCQVIYIYSYYIAITIAWLLLKDGRIKAKINNDTGFFLFNESVIPIINIKYFYVYFSAFCNGRKAEHIFSCPNANNVELTDVGLCEMFPFCK